MVMKLKEDPSKDKKLMDVIRADKKEIKSKAAPEDVKTFLLYIPKPLHKKLKNRATNSDVGLHEYIIKVLGESCAD